MDLGLGLRRILKQLQGAALVDEKTVNELVRELQRVLISSDVNVKLVLQLSETIKRKALEKELKGWDAKEHIIKLVYDELVLLLGGEEYSPKIKPHKILLLGLYGSGKTTTAGKMARFYKKKGLSVCLVACDVSRPAAYEQLEQLAKQAEVSFFGIKGKKADEVAHEALSKCREDVLIFDSAGRNAFDPELAEELKRMNGVIKAEEKFLVLSADIGQVAGKQAEEFNSNVGITGVIVTKMEGSGKGGGALSAVAKTKVPICFIGVGEKLDSMELFDSKRYVSKLLGFPDLESLLEKVKELEKEVPEDFEAEELNLKTFYQQMKMIKKMGSFRDIAGMLGMVDLPKDMVEQSEEKLKSYEAIINSMTPEEREEPKVLRKEKARIERIAKGSGKSAEDVRRLLSEFEKMEKLFKRVKTNKGMMKKLSKMLGGKLQ